MATLRGESLLLDLDANLVACVLLHLQPTDLAHVAQTCSALAREANADVVWCTLFLRRFGSDFWGEATPDPHPYTAVPEERNAWRAHPISDVFARFSACNGASSTRADDTDWSARAAADGSDEDGERLELTKHVDNLKEFVRSHATGDGYGGWKKAYQRMHEMVTEWRTPVTESIIVAGLPAFATLDAITDIVRSSLESVQIVADLVSPGGQCRVIRAAYATGHKWWRPSDSTNICVIRKPRNWYRAVRPRALFRGLRYESELERYKTMNPKLIYVVDGERMERSERYQELVYKELHGVLGEGKGRFDTGLAVALYILNTTT